MNHLVRKLAYKTFKLHYRIHNKHLILGNNVEIRMGSFFEGYNKICDNSHFYGKLGYGSYIGSDSVILANVGRFCSIASKVNCITKTHPVKEWVSTHPAFYSTKAQSGFTFTDKQLFDEEPKLDDSIESIVIGNDVYIGYGVTIIGPVRIGDGAVITANATVVKDVEPYSIVGGTPAKEIKKRFSEEDIGFLKTIQWWNKDIEWLKQNAKYFSSVENLKKIIYKESE